MGSAEPSSSSKVFVCYSRRDMGTVDRIVAELEGRGHALWIDRADIVSSEVWRDKIAHAVQGCDALMFFASEDSLASPQVDAEITLAKEFGKPVVPVFLSQLQPTGAIAYSIAGLHRIYYRGGDSLAEIDLALRTLKQPGAAGLGTGPIRQPARRAAVWWPVVAAVLISAGGLLAWKLTDRPREGELEPAPRVVTPAPEPEDPPPSGLTAETPMSLVVEPAPEPEPEPESDSTRTGIVLPLSEPASPGLVLDMEKLLRQPPHTEPTSPGTVQPLDPSEFDIKPPRQD